MPTTPSALEPRPRALPAACRRGHRGNPDRGGGGHFARGGEPEAFAGVEAAAAALGVTRRVEIPEAHRARAAAMTITAAEGAHLHVADLRSRAGDFDPCTRGRFLAGALVPAAY